MGKIREGNELRLGEMIVEEEKELDDFNLVVAKYRVENGMSLELISLYTRMGNYSKSLQCLKKEADRIKEHFSKLPVKF